MPWPLLPPALPTWCPLSAPPPPNKIVCPRSYVNRSEVGNGTFVAEHQRLLPDRWAFFKARGRGRPAAPPLRRPSTARPPPQRAHVLASPHMRCPVAGPPGPGLGAPPKKKMTRPAPRRPTPPRPTPMPHAPCVAPQFHLGEGDYQAIVTVVQEGGGGPHAGYLDLYLKSGQPASYGRDQFDFRRARAWARARAGARVRARARAGARHCRCCSCLHRYPATAAANRNQQANCLSPPPSDPTGTLPPAGGSCRPPLMSPPPAGARARGEHRRPTCAAGGWQHQHSASSRVTLSMPPTPTPTTPHHHIL